jgi:hypothetical protein
MAAGTTTWWQHAAAGCIPPPPQTHRLTEFLQLCCSACWYVEMARLLRPAALRDLRPWIDIFSEIFRFWSRDIPKKNPSWDSFPANMITSRYAGITETHPCTAANLLSDFFAYLLLPVFSNCLSKVQNKSRFFKTLHTISTTTHTINTHQTLCTTKHPTNSSKKHIFVLWNTHANDFDSVGTSC